MIRNQKIKGNFICGPLASKWMVYFSFRLFFNWSKSIYSKYKLFIFTSLCILVFICYNFLNAVICSLITLFFKCIKLHQILSQFSTTNLALALDISIFERDYSNLKNPIPSRDINLWYIYKVSCR